MTATAFECPRCLRTSRRESAARFCPHCGLEIAASKEKSDPFEIKIPGDRVTVGDLLAYGQVANLYYCHIHGISRGGVFKIARTHLANAHISRGADTLAKLHASDSDQQAGAFFPQPLATINYNHAAGEPLRTAVVLRYHDAIRTPDELYTLEEVHAAHPRGLDPRDMAWMWRRLLGVLGYIHLQRIAHGMVTPAHVLIEPRDHKVVLIGWCGAVLFGQPRIIKPMHWQEWGLWSDNISAATDIAAGAKTMSYLLGTNPEPAIARHLERASDSSASAGRLLDDFDRLIEALWGKRQFRPFTMPARDKAKEATHG